MAADDQRPEDTAGDTLTRISNEIVRAQKAFFGKGPTQAKTYLFDDMLFCVLRGGLTVAEKTMLEFGHEDLVRRFRQVFENEMTGRFTTLVEEATGRKVANYQSQVMFDPDVIVEMFVFDRDAPADLRQVAADEQARPTGTGEADDEALEAPSDAGR